MISYSKKMIFVKPVSKHIKFLALLLLLTSNLPFLKVGALSLSFFIGIILLLIAGGKYLYIGKNLKPLAFFTFFSIVALVLSPVGLSAKSAFVLLQIVYWFFLALLFRNIWSQVSLKTISKVVIFVEILFSVLFIFYGGENPDLSENFSSFIIVTLWPLSTCLFSKRIWKITAVLLAIMSLFLIGSRTGIIVVFIQLVSIYVVRNMTGKGKIILLVSFFLFSALLSSQSIRTTISKTIEPLNQDIALLIEDPELVFIMDKSWAQRRIQQEKCKQLFQQHPIIGVGPMNVVNYKISINTSNLSDIDAQVLNYEMRHSDNRSAHNAYYQLIADNGIIGALLLLYFFVFLLVGLYKKSLVSEDHIVYFISLIGLVLNLFMVSALWGTNTWLLFGMYASMLVIRPTEGNTGLAYV